VLIEWTDDLAIGHAEIDRDHQNLVDILNRLHDAMQEGQGRQILSQIINDLAKYAHEHFSREETLMRESGFHEFERHKKRHAELLQQLNEIAVKHGNGSFSVTMETMNFLREWLRVHIQREDAKLAALFRT